MSSISLQGEHNLDFLRQSKRSSKFINLLLYALFDLAHLAFNYDSWAILIPKAN